jgi:hypothetical protein
MATLTATLAGLSWTAYAANTTDLIAAVAVDLNMYAAVTVTPRGASTGTATLVKEASGVVVDNMQGTSDLTVQIGPVVEFVPRYQKAIIPLFPGSPDVVFSGVGIMPRVYFYVGTFRGVGTGLNAFASNQAANVASITGGVTDAYLNTLRWKINFQLSAGFNLDNVFDSGFYDVLNPTNSGTGLPAGTYGVQVFTYSGSPLFIYQRAWNIVAATISTYERRCVVGTWSAWKVIDPDTVAAAAVANRLQFDAPQFLTGAQQAQARANINGQAALGFTPLAVDAQQGLTVAQQAVGRGNINAQAALGFNPVAYDAQQTLTSAQRSVARGNISAQADLGYSPLAVDAPQTLTTPQQRTAASNIGFVFSDDIAGIHKLPDGSIRQWGYYSGGAANPTITFPVAFPTNVRVVLVTPDVSLLSNEFVGVAALSPNVNGFSAASRYLINGTIQNYAAKFYWEAWGK